ncbi:MAG: hypothetical protein KAJ53_09935, partial [Anaerolineales bacterium]|nr:hypothetical protein [Anaerolineales bacterium]
MLSRAISTPPRTLWLTARRWCSRRTRTAGDASPLGVICFHQSGSGGFMWFESFLRNQLRRLLAKENNIALESRIPLLEGRF